MYFTCSYGNNLLDNTKTWNDVTFWFSQNDFLQATRTICANYSQGNQALFGENAGKQCVTMSLTAVIYHHLEDINVWTSSTLNNIQGGLNSIPECNVIWSSSRCSTWRIFSERERIFEVVWFSLTREEKVRNAVFWLFIISLYNLTR